jgi:hypothetical protein
MKAMRQAVYDFEVLYVSGGAFMFFGDVFATVWFCVIFIEAKVANNENVLQHCTQG